MSEDEIVAYLYQLSGWRSGANLDKAFKKAANYMLNHDGKGGGTVHHFDGKTVFHATEGQGEVTVFFTNQGGDVVSICGIGEHSGPKSKTATYTLTWKSASWKPNKSVGPRQTVPVNQISL